MTASTHRGRRAKSEAARQKAIAALESQFGRSVAWHDPRRLATKAIAALEAAGLRVVECRTVVGQAQ